MSREESKASYYIQKLDEARCDGNWNVVQELLRKIRKHAPQRSCLTATAECEYVVATAENNELNKSKPRPGTGYKSATATDLEASSISRYIPLLVEASKKQQADSEDIFQARVCLGWIHWHLHDYASALCNIPDSIELQYSQFDGAGRESSNWTKVCALKAAYIKGSSEQKRGAFFEAQKTFESALPVLTNGIAGTKQGKELQVWTELYLTGFCMISSHLVKTRNFSVSQTVTLSAFRAWASFWDSQGSAPTGGRAYQAEVCRRQVWREYYNYLSKLLQEQLPFPTTALTTTYTELSTKLQQRAELKRIEAKYENLILSELHFPKAEEASDEVEAFVDVVVQNWRILCGNDWKEQDLGEGGAEAVSRGVLDILYRAGTKTFHSTMILRHLFTVHLAVAEFELAFKAFNTYMEIVKKGKARVEKTGKVEHGLDSDDTVLRTASECIKALCRYDSRKWVEKANNLSQYFEDWIEKRYPSEPKGNGHLLEDNSSDSFGNRIAPQTFALIWRCIGIGHAAWARSTFDAESRSEIQSKAIKCFRRALLPQYENSRDPETLCALGIILAERRELSTAMEAVKSGLLLPSSAETSYKSRSLAGNFARERSLIPLWHLMTLLLSARQEFVTAVRSCEGVLEQFQDQINLFSEMEPIETYRSNHLNATASTNQGIIEDMDDFEKENVLQIKMTQLVLIETLEGPDSAVNASDELLSLYIRLFGNLPSNDPAPQATSIIAPPKTSSGTIRSIKGSIFGRSLRKLHTSGAPVDHTSTGLRSPTAMSTRAPTRLRSPTMSTRAPTIHVTSENSLSIISYPLAPANDIPEKMHKRTSSLPRKSAKNKSCSTGRARSRSGGISLRKSAEDFEDLCISSVKTQDQDEALECGKIKSRVSSGTSTKATLKHPSNLGTHQMMPSEDLSPKTQRPSQQHNPVKASNNQDEFSLTGSTNFYPTNPPIRFSKDLQRRRQTAILIKVWLLISGFYRRASMYEDAKGAIDEAITLVKGLDLDSKDSNSSLPASDARWEDDKCIMELWSDIYAELGHVAVSEDMPYSALENFESALIHFGDHPSAIVGLSNILLDVYTGELPPAPSFPSLMLPGSITPLSSNINRAAANVTRMSTQKISAGPSSSLPMAVYGPLGSPIIKSTSMALKSTQEDAASIPEPHHSGFQPSYKDSSTAILDRLAARDRAYGLLTALTRMGTGWNYSEAWFALARAYEEGGQSDKAREVLWWCVELEDGRAVRDWDVVGSGGYVF